MESSDFETELCMNHLERRWRQISLIKDGDLRMKEKTKFSRKTREIVESLFEILEGSRRDRSEYHPFGLEG